MRVLSKNIADKNLDYRDRTFPTSFIISISRSMASNKHDHFSPAILLGVFLDGIKKFIHQAGLRINVKFVLCARDDQHCITTKQNWNEKIKNTANKSFTSQDNLFWNQGGKVKVMNRVKYSKNEAVKK